MLRDVHFTRPQCLGMVLGPRQAAANSEEQGMMLLGALLPMVLLALAPAWRAPTGARTGRKHQLIALIREQLWALPSVSLTAAAD